MTKNLDLAAAAGDRTVLVVDRRLTGCAHILQERLRQIESEGWTPEHDDEHDGHEMARAAACYALAAAWFRDFSPAQLDASGTPEGWPWGDDWWKPSGDPIRNLVKAGALIAAEIDRLLRKQGIERGSRCDE